MKDLGTSSFFLLSLMRFSAHFFRALGWSNMFNIPMPLQSQYRSLYACPVLLLHRKDSSIWKLTLVQKRVIFISFQKLPQCFWPGIRDPFMGSLLWLSDNSCRKYYFCSCFLYILYNFFFLLVLFFKYPLSRLFFSDDCLHVLVSSTLKLGSFTWINYKEKQRTLCHSRNKFLHAP